jgi:hypothetical protein
MTPDRDLLRRMDGLPEPRHLFVLPGWVDSAALDRLAEQGCVTFGHVQRNPHGVIQVAMNLELTPKGRRLIRPDAAWKSLALKGSLAGVSFTAMSFLILYLG